MAYQLWADATASIDAGRPVFVVDGRHAFVLTGYEVTGGKRLFSVNDPWNWPGQSGTLKLDIDANGDQTTNLSAWILPPGASGTRQEASITADSDGDGVVDFDEAERFQTNPNDPDSDGDKLPDKQDIVTGVFDPPYGYALDPGPDGAGRDFDADGNPTERDPDSDSAGCQDGEEDTNLDGHRNGSETWNFDVSDDLCFGYEVVATLTETWEGLADTTITATGRATEVNVESGLLEGKGTFSGSTYGAMFCPIEGDDPEVTKDVSGPARITVIVSPDGIFAAVDALEGGGWSLSAGKLVPLEGGTATTVQEVPPGTFQGCGSPGTIVNTVTVTPLGDEP